MSPGARTVSLVNVASSRRPSLISPTSKVSVTHVDLAKIACELFLSQGEACGPYGHDIHLREVCAAWKRPPIAEMTRKEYQEWMKVEQQVKILETAG